METTKLGDALGLEHQRGRGRVDERLGREAREGHGRRVRAWTTATGRPVLKMLTTAATPLMDEAAMCYVGRLKEGNAV